MGAVTKTTAYTYGDANWKDKLTAYDGKAITYDQIGNPLTYGGNTFAWTGRQLDSISGNGNTIAYKYNASGIRTQKTVNGVSTKYFIEGDGIVLEKAGNEERAFWYDGNGNAAAFVIYDAAGMHPYYYFRNGQGDIIGLFDSNGNIVARYSYDSWGNLLKITDGSGNNKTNDTAFVGYKNPLRYRGYYYDSETKLYYLQSRYYSPEWGRFLNADGIIGANGDLTSNNLFTYCSNNPVMFADPSGYCSWCGNPSYNAASMSSSAWERHVQKYSPAPAKVTVTTRTKNDTKNWVLRPNEVIVIDKRDNIINNDQHDPNFIVVNSYAITDKETMRYIANYLIVYDCENPTEYKWGRTADSIVFEWEVHNNYYYNVSFSRSSTTDVDLNTLDEGKSGWDFFIDAVQKAFNKIF